MSDAVIIGAGPAGLAAGYELSRHGANVVILEKLEQVGGLSRTTERHELRWDIGPHRFFTKNAEIRQLWRDVLGQDLLSITRLTRVFYQSAYFEYPLKIGNVLSGLGPLACLGIVASYLSARSRQALAPIDPANFEEWVALQFGRRLYETFFRTYTEKVWGIPCTRIASEWAGQRIKGLTLWTALVNAVLKPKAKSIKTLVDEFLYPRLGAGMLYQRMAQRIEERGGRVILGREAVEIRRDDGVVRSVVAVGPGAEREEYETSFLLSTAPLTHLVDGVVPAPPDAVVAASRKLRFRGHISVNIEISGRAFPDNWVYVHSPEVQLARVADYCNFSEHMGNSGRGRPMTVEYFSFVDDETWRRSDDELIEIAQDELVQLGMISRGQVRTGFVLRSPFAYPTLEIGHERHLACVKSWLGSLRNLQTIGRAGMFKYNNQDHSILTGLLAARAVLGLGQYDPWLVNTDAEYHEAGEAR
ncbi:MAG: FAD-dependent oxidoreductase [Armatimonadota bacterium]